MTISDLEQRQMQRTLEAMHAALEKEFSQRVTEQPGASAGNLGLMVVNDMIHSLIVDIFHHMERSGLFSSEAAEAASLRVYNAYEDAFDAELKAAQETPRPGDN